MSNIRSIYRRRFLRTYLLGGSGGLLVGGMPVGVFAQHHNTLSEDDPLARSLGYRHDARQVDTTAFPKRSGRQGESQYCFNCSLYRGDVGEQFGPCSIFQNKLVAGKGWCNAWVATS